MKLRLLKKATNEQVGINEEMELLRKIQEDNDFPKFLKSMLPAVTYPEIFRKKENDFAHIISFPSGMPKVVSDNPIIYRNLPNETLHTDEYIFPLSPTQLLIRNKFKGVIIPSFVRVMIDLMLLLQAKEYISCTDQKYPLMLLDYSTKFSSIEDLREKIFKNIYLEIA